MTDASTPSAGLLDLADGVPLVVVSTRPAALVEQLSRHRPSRPVIDIAGNREDPRRLLIMGGAEPGILIGDPESWQGAWGAIAALRGSAALLFVGCSVSEFRTLSGVRQLPPPAPFGERALWLLESSGGLSRARLPAGDGSADGAGPFAEEAPCDIRSVDDGNGPRHR